MTRLGDSGVESHPRRRLTHLPASVEVKGPRKGSALLVWCRHQTVQGWLSDPQLISHLPARQRPTPSLPRQRQWKPLEETEICAGLHAWTYC